MKPVGAIEEAPCEDLHWGFGGEVWLVSIALYCTLLKFCNECFPLKMLKCTEVKKFTFVFQLPS